MVHPIKSAAEIFLSRSLRTLTRLFKKPVLVPGTVNEKQNFRVQFNKLTEHSAVNSYKTTWTLVGDRNSGLIRISLHHMQATKNRNHQFLTFSFYGRSWLTVMAQRRCSTDSTFDFKWRFRWKWCHRSTESDEQQLIISPDGWIRWKRSSGFSRLFGSDHEIAYTQQKTLVRYLWGGRCKSRLCYADRKSSLLDHSVTSLQTMETDYPGFYVQV